MAQLKLIKQLVQKPKAELLAKSYYNCILNSNKLELIFLYKN